MSNALLAPSTRSSSVLGHLRPDGGILITTVRARCYDFGTDVLPRVLTELAGRAGE
jgi:hypothetical protein